MKSVLLLSAALGLAVNAWGTCNPALPQTTPDNQFLLKASNTIVRDNKTGLQWQRCSLGQTWNTTNNRCDIDGTPALFSWEQALAAAKANRLSGFGDWRLPNKKELASLLELSCSSPAINTTLFPNTVSGRYWTSTPVSYADSFYVWFVDFTSGDYGNLTASTASLSARLVRDSE